jgi:V8-like Glu-specific endopeptidase
VTSLFLFGAVVATLALSLSFSPHHSLGQAPAPTGTPTPGTPTPGPRSPAASRSQRDWVGVRLQPPRPGAVSPSLDGFAPSLVIGTDDRLRVSPTTGYPWSAVTSLEVSFANGLITVLCSGSIIGPTTVLTAGHCVYDHQFGFGFATSIRVIPGRDGTTTEPFGSQPAVSINTTSGWVNEQDHSVDIAVVGLPNSDLTSVTGRFKFAAGNGASLLGITTNISGYPAERTNQQWASAGPIGDREYSPSTDTGRLLYLVDTTSGQSGSPIWLYNGTERVIVGVHTSNCVVNSTQWNCGTTITNWLAGGLEFSGADPRVSPSGPYAADPLPGQLTPTPTPSATASRTATATRTVTRTPTATVTVSPTTIPGGTIGGRGLRLTAQSAGGIQLAWDAGTRQTGYVVYRFGDGGEAVMPLPAAAVAFPDNPSGTIACYIVLVVEGDSVIAVSDLLCTMPASGAPPWPAGVTIRSDQGTTATVSWSPVSGTSNYLLYVGQAPERSQLLAPTSLTASDPTGGLFTCYAVVVLQASQTGHGRVVCVMPGQSVGL